MENHHKLLLVAVLLLVAYFGYKHYVANGNTLRIGTAKNTAEDQYA